MKKFTRKRLDENAISGNFYDCPKSLWKKMTVVEQIRYNQLRAIKQDVIDPKGSCPAETFDVISHNYSYLAATL